MGSLEGGWDAAGFTENLPDGGHTAPTAGHNRDMGTGPTDTRTWKPPKQKSARRSELKGFEAHHSKPQQGCR